LPELSFIHSFIYLLNKAIKKCAVKCIIEQDSKAKALTAAQKLQNYTKTMEETNSKSTIISATHTNSK